MTRGAANCQGIRNAPSDSPERCGVSRWPACPPQRFGRILHTAVIVLGALGAASCAVAVSTAVAAETAPGPRPLALQRVSPRLYGYVLGDTLVEQVTVRATAPYTLDRRSLPPAGKRNAWFAVRDCRVAESSEAGGHVYRIALEFQLINTPPEVRTVQVPAVALRFSGPQPLTEIVPEESVDVAPLTTGTVRNGLDDMSPSRPAQAIPTGTAAARLGGSFGLAALALAWMGVRRYGIHWRRRRSGPFARALRDLSHRRGDPADEGLRLAVQRVHRAFDETAGRRLFFEQLEEFLKTRGVGAALQADTRAFFQASRALFFGQAAIHGRSAPLAGAARETALRESGPIAAPPAGAPTGWDSSATADKHLKALCDAWRRHERGLS